MLHQCADTPVEWCSLIEEFAKSPSEERWHDLMRRVDPEVIEERGEGSPARAVWLGLAAQASFARGDRFGTIRYLREASRERSSKLALASIVEIRTEADAVLNAELDRAGIPNY